MNWMPTQPTAERHILGAILLDPNEAGAAFERLKPEDFAFQRNAEIFEACCALYSESGQVDPQTLLNFLSRNPGFNRAKGEADLMDISAEVVSAAYVASHVALVKDSAFRRRMILASGRLLEGARDPQKTNAEVMGEAESFLLSLSEEQVAQGLVPFRSITAGTLSDLALSASGELTGVPTGLLELNRITGGLQATDLIILAGRPAMGKTALGLTISWRAALKHGQKVAFFSMEMGKKQLQQRVFCAHQNLDLHKLRQGKLTQEEMDKFKTSVAILDPIPLHIDDQNGKTPLQILSQCKRMKARLGLNLIVVDFCQLGRMDKEMENRQQEVGEFAYALKGIAKDLNVPVVGLAQLNREVDKRNGDENGNVAYKLSDLNESGKLEQAADIVGVIHRPEVLSRKAESGYAQLQVIKFRNGPTGDIDLRFNCESASFSDYIPPNWLEGGDHASHHRAPKGPRGPAPKNDWGDPGPSLEPYRGARPGEAGFND